MPYRIHHQTVYDFSQPVFLEPHTIRLTPRGDVAQRVLKQHRTITPTPVGVTEQLDAAGNCTTLTWFSDLTDRLSIEIDMEVELLRSNPFDFILPPDATQLPVAYSPADQYMLWPYLHRQDESGADLLNTLVQQARDESSDNVLPFLWALNRLLNERVEVRTRLTGSPLAIEDLLTDNVGACRDLAVVYVEACRAVGLPARFVSGYHDPGPDGEASLHAWAEVYLPAAGWRAFDPSAGVAVADRHITLAAAALPAEAAPVTGTFRGTEATANMHAELTITRVESSCTPA